MNKKLWIGAGGALLLTLLFTVTLLAQNTDLANDTANTAFAEIEPVSAVVQQQVPISVTLRLPVGTTGTQTVTIPMLLSLDITFNLTELGDPSLVVSAENVSLATPIAAGRDDVVTPLPTVAPTQTPASTPTVANTFTPIATATTAATATPTATATLTATATPVVVAPVCPDSRAVILSPGENQVISDTVSIFGTATHENFEYYKLEYAAGAAADAAAAEFFYLDGGNFPIENDRLAIIDTGSFVNGFYTVRLIVVDQTGNFPEPCQVTVEIRN